MLEQPWRMTMFGGLRVQQPARVITRFHTNKTGLLLAFLAFYPKRTHPRELLTEMLWPESEPEAGRTNLRVALNSLRNQLEPPGVATGSVLLADRTNIHLNPKAVTTDVADFEAAIRKASRTSNLAERIHHLTSALDLYEGELLPAFYSDWVLSERSRLQEAYLDTLRQVSSTLAQSGDINDAINYARRAVTADPSREEAHYELMRLYVTAGRTADAQQQYSRLEEVLRNEFGDAPSPATSALLESVREGESRTYGRAVVPAGPAAMKIPGREAVKPAPLPAAVGLLPEETPLREAPTPRLPLQFTRFFGREEEIAGLRSLFQGEQGLLVTLTGPGGSGKTRLAIEFGRQASGWIDRWVSFVPLSDVAEPHGIADAIARSLSLELAPGQHSLDQVVESLCARPTLLILDNFEHLAQAGIPTLQALRSRVPGLYCLVTSQRTLGLSGERERPLHPLPTPTCPDAPERLLEFASVKLFVDRAQLVRPDFQVTTRNAAAVASVCDRLEGIPLAIELAAAWAQMLSPAQMLSKLECRFDLLESRNNDAPERHRTLRAALEWSYRLLDPPLQGFFRALSVFRGGWTLEAAEAVCDEPRTLTYLSELHARSLVVSDVVGDEIRYRLLETLRDFAQEQEDADWTALRRRHAIRFLELAETSRGQLQGPDQCSCMERLDREHNNLRTALEWAAPNDVALELRMAIALWRFWYQRGYLTEGRYWLDDSLSRTDAGAGDARAKALNQAGLLACAQGDYGKARAYHEVSLSSYKAVGNRLGMAAVLNNLGIVHRHLGDVAAARPAYEESLSIYQEMDHKAGQAAALSNLGSIAMEMGSYNDARSLLEQSASLYDALGDKRSMAIALHNIGEAAYYQNEEDCQRYFVESLAIRRDAGDRSDIAISLTSLARVATDRGESERAVRLLAAAQAGRDAIGAPIPPAERETQAALIAGLRARLSAAAYAASWDAGLAMTVDESVEYALRPSISVAALMTA